GVESRSVWCGGWGGGSVWGGGMFWASCLGVELWGEAKRATGVAPAAGWAHSEQNFAVSKSWLPQFEQVRASGAAHSSQNFAPERFSCWHRGHFIQPLRKRAPTVGTVGRT